MALWRGHLLLPLDLARFDSRQHVDNLDTANFQRLAGAAPKTLEMDQVNQELERMAALVDASGAPTNPARKVMESLAT
jgi:hypothetical protein